MQSINAPSLPQKMQKVLRFACPAVDPDPSKDFSFQVLRKLSNEPSVPTPSRAQEHRVWRGVQGPDTATTTSELRLWALHPCPQESSSCPKALQPLHHPAPEDLELSLHPGPASPPLSVFRQLVITKSIFLSLTISIFLILT